MPNLARREFVDLVQRERARRDGKTIAIPLAVRLLSDQLTPVLAYRRLVAADERDAPSFLLESVEGGERLGRYSIMGAQPTRQVLARGDTIVLSHRAPDGRWIDSTPPERDPFAVLRSITRDIELVRPPARGASDELPSCVLGGLFGFAAYDSVRYAEPDKLGFAAAPPDDRRLPDLHFAFYQGVVVFDHVGKVVFLVELALINHGDDPEACYDRAIAALQTRIDVIERHSKPLAAGLLERAETPPAPLPSNMTREAHAAMIARAMEYIRAGDIFQVVLGQRFERVAAADPFDVYRALRAVNPSPYMVYMQASGCILIASSPEILCRVRKHTDPAGGAANPAFVVTNRPLAGTRRRGESPEEDAKLEGELRADQKECAEHIMLVDLGRNDVGRVARTGSVTLASTMEIERYSHVMHLSSTVTGVLRPGLDSWDALRAALPVGTISGAPKIRAMQIIDELEPIRRGPYGGGMGYVGLDGEMDIALTLRTIVAPTALHRQGPDGDRWTYHLQASGGIVADSKADDEYAETVNKAAALARAIAVAERAFAPAHARPA